MAEFAKLSNYERVLRRLPHGQQSGTRNSRDGQELRTIRASCTHVQDPTGVTLHLAPRDRESVRGKNATVYTTTAVNQHAR